MVIFIVAQIRGELLIEFCKIKHLFTIYWTKQIAIRIAIINFRLQLLKFHFCWPPTAAAKTKITTFLWIL